MPLSKKAHLSLSKIRIHFYLFFTFHIDRHNINPRRTLEALELITDVNIFEQYCQEEGFDYDSFFKELENLTFRRNEIVHKMDIKNKLTLERNEITMNEVDNYISIIEKLVLHIIARI